MVCVEIPENKRDARSREPTAKTGERRAVCLFTQSDDDRSFYGHGRDRYFIWFNNAHFYHDAAVCFDEHSGFKYIEEPELEKRFGQEYREYKERTPVIIPGSTDRRKRNLVQHRVFIFRIHPSLSMSYFFSNPDNLK
jgi:hypothetical protein